MREYELKYDILSISENYCKVQLSSLPKGMGQTIGNALRRILLNELEGTAVRAFHLNNLSGIPLRCNSVVEDTATIMLTLSQLHVRRLPSADGSLNTMPFIMEGSNNGKDCITFGDLKPLDPSMNVKVLNPDIPILHVGTVISQSTPENPTKEFMPVTIKVLICDGVYFTLRSTKASSSIKGMESSIVGFDTSDTYIDCNTCYQPVERVNYYVETKQLREDIDAIIQQLIHPTADTSKPKKSKKAKPIENMESSLEAYYAELIKIKNKHGLTSEIFEVLKQLDSDDSKLDIIDDTPITFTTTVKDLANALTDILRKTALFYSASPVLQSEYDVLEENSDKYTEDLVLEIKTNGCVDPFDALEQALETLEKFTETTSELVKEHNVNSTQFGTSDLIWQTASSELQKQGKTRLHIDEVPNLPVEVYNTLKGTEVVNIDVLEQETTDVIFGRTNIDKVTKYLEEANINVKE